MHRVLGEARGEWQQALREWAEPIAGDGGSPGRLMKCGTQRTMIGPVTGD